MSHAHCLQLRAMLLLQDFQLSRTLVDGFCWYTPASCAPITTGGSPLCDAPPPDSAATMSVRLCACSASGGGGGGDGGRRLSSSTTDEKDEEEADEEAGNGGAAAGDRAEGSHVVACCLCSGSVAGASDRAKVPVGLKL